MNRSRLFSVGALTAALLTWSAPASWCDPAAPPPPPAASKSAAPTPPAAKAVDAAKSVAASGPQGLTADAAKALIAAMSDKDRKEMQSEQKAGADAAAEIEKEGKLSKDKALLDRVNAVGNKIAAIANTVQIPAQFGNNKVYPFTWTFHVIDSDDVNAFSLPGGYVYVNAGLLKLIGTDDELAGVLGHETTHSAHHHIAMLAHEQGKINTDLAIAMIAAALAHASGEDLGNIGMGASLTAQGIMNNRYSENAERDADHGGIIYMTKAGYNPIGMLTFMEKLQELEHRSVDIPMGIFQDHPYTDERVGNIRAQLASMGITPNDTEEYTLSKAPATFTSKAGTGKMREIIFDDTVCATVFDPDGSRTTALLKSINSSFAHRIEMGDVTSSDDEVLIDDRPWLTVEPQDLASTSGTSPADAAGQIARSLRFVIYKRSFLSLDTASASVKPTEKAPIPPPH